MGHRLWTKTTLKLTCGSQKRPNISRGCITGFGYISGQVSRGTVGPRDKTTSLFQYLSPLWHSSSSQSVISSVPWATVLSNEHLHDRLWHWNRCGSISPVRGVRFRGCSELLLLFEITSSLSRDTIKDCDRLNMEHRILVCLGLTGYVTKPRYDKCDETQLEHKNVATWV